MINLDAKLKKISKEKYIVMSIFGLGLLLRLIGSIRVGLVFDEAIWLEAARKVSFSPDNFSFALHGAFHPFFEVYLIKLSSVLFSYFLFDNNLLQLIAERLSVRFLHVLLSSATIIIIYYLVKDGLGKSPATFAALLTAFSQFHIHFSRTVIQTAPLLFFVSLSLLFFWKAVNQSNDKFIILTGLSIGFGYLCEETSSLLFVIFTIFLIMSKRIIQWLKKWETYVAILAFLLIISPDLYWNITAQSSDMKFHLTRAANFQGVSLLPTCLFIGELFLMCVKDLESFVGFGRHARWTIEYPTMHWVLGVLCLLAIIYSFKKRKNDFVKLMQITFLFIFIFFTFFASSGPLGNFNFWWASISFIPAIVLVSDMSSEIFHRKSFLKWLTIIFVFYFFCHSIYFLSINENIYVRRPSFLTKIYNNIGRTFLLKGLVLLASDKFKKALKYEPKSVTALVNLAECYKRKSQHRKAESFWKEAQEKNSNSNRFLFDRGYLKEWLINGYYEVSDSSVYEINDLSMANPYKNLDIPKNIKDQKYERIMSPSAFIDLKKLLRNPPNTFSYAFTQIYSPMQQKVNLLVGVDDGLTIWLNREKVYEDNEKGWWFPDEDTITVNLIQGWNDLLLRVLYNRGQYYGFTIRLADSTGEIIDNIQSKAILPRTIFRKTKN